MPQSAQLSRRSFVILASTILPASRLAAFERRFAITSNPFIGSLAQAKKIYICPPCGLNCDKLEFDKPGICPVCGMTLIEKGSGTVARAAPAGVVRFPQGKSSVEFPFELLANGVFLQLQVNGKGPLTFEMDTGSVNSIVASEIVAELGIKTQGTSQGLGSGTSFALSQISDLEFQLPGGLALSTSNGAAVSMANLSPLIARRFDGDLGFDVLRQLVVKINYEKQLITLYDPAHFEYRGSGTTIPFTLWANYDPQIEGEISVPGKAPIPIKIVLDSGAGGSILTTPFVKAHELTTSMKTLPTPDVGAGGGESTKWQARAVSIRIGPYLIDKPLVALSTDTVGSLAHADFDLNLGGNILRRFTVIIDYPKNRLILETNSHFHEPFAADASGLVLKAEGADFKTFVVTAIVPNSPATQAGLQVGDVIGAINGASAQRYALWELQDLFKSSGYSCELTIQRGQTSLVCKLSLRALL